MNCTMIARGIFVMVTIPFVMLTELKAQQDSVVLMSSIETDRPSQGKTASLVPKGYFQMENGFSIEDTEPGFIYTHPSSLWKIGVSEYFEIRILTEYINIQQDPNPKVDGFLPIQVGLKAKLLEQKGIVPKTSLISQISLPGIASKQFQQTYFAPAVRLAFQHDLHDRFSVSYNAGVQWDGEIPRPEFIYSLALGADIFSKLGIYAELYGSMPQQREEDAELRADAGFTYLISNDVVVDISGGIGITDNAPEKYIAAGLSYRFKM